MKETNQKSLIIKINSPGQFQYIHSNEPTKIQMPARSKLYGMAPYKGETIWGESLTGYINRLAWRYRIGARWLVTKELATLLSNRHYASFFRKESMHINGNGKRAEAWSGRLEELTCRNDLHILTCCGWAQDLLNDNLFRKRPAWCAACYDEWEAKDMPIYQPLLWLFSFITVCLQHKRQLDEQCPSCGKYQSIIATKVVKPGACTQCCQWLGIKEDSQKETAIYIEIQQQTWFFRMLDEILKEYSLVGSFHWNNLFKNLRNYLTYHKAVNDFERLTGMYNSEIYKWGVVHTQDLRDILQICYICKITPHQIVTNQMEPLALFLQKGISTQSLRGKKKGYHRVDESYCRRQIQAILESKEVPSLYQIAKRLGYAPVTLYRHFPSESAEVVKRYRSQREASKKQREERIRQLVKETVLKLYSENIFPSYNNVSALLPSGMFRDHVAQRTWKEAQRELGLRK